MEENHEYIPHIAIHPGELIKDELQARPNLTQKALASELGIKPSLLNELIMGKRAISADLAILLEHALGIKAEYWMNLQSRYEINLARIKDRNIRQILTMKEWQLIKESVPIKYLRKLQYLSGDLDKDIATIKSIYWSAGPDSHDGVVEEPQCSYPRVWKVTDALASEISAWKAIAQYEANRIVTSESYTPSVLEALCVRLRDVFYRNEHLIPSIAEALKESGIKLVMLPKFDKIKIQYYLFYSGTSPAAVITVPQKRIDRFGKVLMDCIALLEVQLTQDTETTVLKEEQVQGVIEVLAEERILPEAVWESICSKYKTLNDHNILSASKNYKVHPAFILRRAAKERKFSFKMSNIDLGIY